jgi:hypothetical protein
MIQAIRAGHSISPVPRTHCLVLAAGRLRNASSVPALAHHGPPDGPWSTASKRRQMAMSGSASSGHGPNCETDVMGQFRTTALQKKIVGGASLLTIKRRAPFQTPAQTDSVIS